MTTQMPVYQPTPCLSETQGVETPFSIAVLAYFRGRLSNRIHELVLSEFANKEREGTTSRAELARKIRRKPEQITRWLGSPGNWTLDTLSDLLLGMGLEPEFSARNLGSERESFWRNQSCTWWAKTYVRPVVVDVQTSQEVARDMMEGNHKSLYFSFRTLPENAPNRTTTIVVQPQQALPQPSLNMQIKIKENAHVNG